MVWKWFGFCELRKVARFAAEIFMRSLFRDCAGEFWKSGCNLFHGFNRIIFIYLYGFGYQNPEKYVSIFRLEKHTSGAKAPAVLLDLLPGINPRPTSCAFVQSIVRKRERPEPVKVRAVAFLLPIMSVSQNPLIACKLSLGGDVTKGSWTFVTRDE